MLSLLLLYRAQIALVTVGEITEVSHLGLDGRAGAGVLGGVSLVRLEVSMQPLYLIHVDGRWTKLTKSLCL
jgi:hypothetical protein